MADMSADVLRNNLTNPARTYLWEIRFSNMIGGGSDIIEARCQSASIPGRSSHGIRIPYKGTPGIKFPGKLTMPQTWSLSFVENVDRKVFDALYGWQQAIQNARTGIGLPDVSLKTDIYLKCLNQATGQPWLTIKLIGAWVEDIPEVALTYDANTIVHFRATFSYDRWEKE